MKYSFGIVFALLAVLVVGSNAQTSLMSLTGAGCIYGVSPSGKCASGGGGYTGPGDVISGATAFYSCARAYNAAYAAAAGTLCVIADAATGATTCTMKSASTGFADLTSLLCGGGTQTVSAFCTAHTSCVVSTMYDQTAGNQCTASPTTCNIVQVTLANMPALTFSALNGLPCLTMATTSQLDTASPLNAIATQPFSIAVVAEQTTGGSNLTMFGGGNPGTFWSSSTTVGMFAGAGVVSATASLNAFHGISFVFNSATSSIQVDSTLTSPLNPGTNGLGIGGNHIVVGATSGGMIGSFCEGGVWPIAFTSGNQSSWFSNANGSSGYNGGL
jgi:hypothetical protein